MPQFNIVNDKTAPLPTIEELRESQRKGAEGIGTASQTYGETQADFNMGTGTE